MNAWILTDPLYFDTLQILLFYNHLWIGLFHLQPVGASACWFEPGHSLMVCGSSLLSCETRYYRFIWNISNPNLESTNLSEVPWFLSTGKVFRDYSMDTKSALPQYWLSGLFSRQGQKLFSREIYQEFTIILPVQVWDQRVLISWIFLFASLFLLC